MVHGFINVFLRVRNCSHGSGGLKMPGLPVKYHHKVAIILPGFVILSTLMTKIYIDDQWDLRTLRTVGKDAIYFPKKPKVVAFWDPRAAKPHPSFGLDIDRDPFRKCPESACIPLPSDGTLEDADAVIFNTRRIGLLMQPETFPKRAHPGQIFVFHNMESPLRTNGLLKHPVFNDAFNLTMTYRTDSDIPVELIHVFPLPDTEEIPIERNLYKSKTKMVVWFVSACTKSGSPRIQYAAELAKFISVDIYGECGNLTCSKGEKESCIEMAEKTYKFYLSFENSACIDYVTEKLRHPLSNNMIPIVMGGVNYDVRAPPHSVINVRDYKSPKDLAEYLTLLDKNEKLYEDYFAWKKTHTVTGCIDRGFCGLCRILHNSSYPYKAGFNAHEWWYKDACEPVDKFAQDLGLEM